MFYVLNLKETVKNNDPYKMSLKNLINELKEMDLSVLDFLEGDLEDSSMEQLVSWILKDIENISAKPLEKKIKALYKDFSFEELYFMYVSSLSDLLAEEFLLQSAMHQGIDIKKDINVYNQAIANMTLKSLVGVLCLYAIVLQEQLLEKGFESVNVEENFTKTRLVRSLRKGSYSLYRGVRNIPIIMSEKEAQLISGLEAKFARDGFGEELINHTSVMCSYRSLEILVAKYCFGNRVNEYVDIKEFIGKEAFNISETKLFLSPVEVFSARKCVPGEDGVVLKLNNHDRIDAIYLAECTRFSFRMIYGVVRYKDGSECPISLRMNYNSTVTLSCYNVVDVMNVIIDYYKIPQEDLECLGDIETPHEYEVLSGKYWLLRKNGYETDIEKAQRKQGKKVKREYAVKSGTYIRKIKGKASAEATEFANKLRITLEEGTTLIKEKDRVYFREIEELGLNA